mgnify:FL=1
MDGSSVTPMNKLKMEKDHLLHKWLNHEATPKELERLMDDPEYASYIQIAEASMGLEPPEMDSEANYEALSKKRSAVRPLRKPNVFSVVWKVAAILALLLAGYYYTTTLNTSVKTHIGQTKTVALPDGSQVVLNSGSAITYTKNDWGRSRELSLVGEAYFKVKKGSKFSVKTHVGTVSVLGTRFNVLARDGLFEVSCYEGLVSVAFNDTVLQLPAGKKIRIAQGSLQGEDDEQSPTPAWLHRESSFEDAPLKAVLDELERQYPVNITTEGVDVEKRFTGTFSHQNLELALQSICEPLRLTFNIETNGAVTINAKNSE